MQEVLLHKHLVWVKRLFEVASFGISVSSVEANCTELEHYKALREEVGSLCWKRDSRCRA